MQQKAKKLEEKIIDSPSDEISLGKTFLPT